MTAQGSSVPDFSPEWCRLLNPVDSATVINRISSHISSSDRYYCHPVSWDQLPSWYGSSPGKQTSLFIGLATSSSGIRILGNQALPIQAGAVTSNDIKTVPSPYSAFVAAEGIVRMWLARDSLALSKMERAQLPEMAVYRPVVEIKKCAGF